MGEYEYDHLSPRNGIVASSKFLNALSEVPATSNMVKETELSGWYNGSGKIRLDKNTDDYREFVITGRCRYMRNKRQRLVKSCDLYRTVTSSKKRDKYGVDLNEWDGSDICFYMNLVWRHVVVTEEVKNILEKKKMKSIYFRKIEDHVQVRRGASQQ